MTDPTNPGDADRAWFHAHIDPIVDAGPIPDAWPVIAARTQGESPAPTAVDDRRSRRPRWLAAAAVVVVLAALGAVVVSSRDDGHDSVTTGQNDEATGWYIPKGLPDGWSLVQANVEHGTLCEHAQKDWRRPASDAVGAGSLSLEIEACTAPQPTPEGDTGPSLGPGIDHSTFTTIGDQTLLTWQSDATWTLTGTGTTREQLVEAAQAIVADPTLADAPQDRAPLDGFEDGGGGAGGGIDTDRGDGTVVHLGLRTASGAHVSYDLYPSGQGSISSPVSLEAPYDLPAQPRALVLRSFATLANEGFGSMRFGTLAGTWPGADVQINTSVFPGLDQIDANGHGPDLDSATEKRLVDALAGALRPATTDEWRAFMRSAEKPVTTDLLRAASIGDLGHPGSAGSSDTTAATPDAGGPTTTSSADKTTTTTVSTTVTASTTGPVTSGPGTSTPNDREQPSFTELDELDIRLELESGTIRAGSPVAGTLVMTNPTDHDVELTECSEGLTSWGLVPEGDPDQELMSQRMIDCFATAVVTVPAGETVRYRSPETDPTWLRWPFLAQRADPGNEVQLNGVGGTLEGGRYLAVMEIPGRTSDLRLSVPVTVSDPGCPTSDADVKRYVNLTEAKARSQAAHDGWAFRVVSGPGSDGTLEQNLTCKRINVDLNQDGVVTNALRY